jgi:hypothetical protein
MKRTGFGGVCAAGVCAVAVLAWSAGATAASKRVGIPKFEGKQEALVRKNVMKALKAHGYELVKSREMDAAIASTGAHLDSDDGLKTLAKELALSAIITGEVGPRRAKIVVHDGAEGSVLGDAPFVGANPRKLAVEVGRDFWRKLGADVGRGQVARGAKKAQKAAAAEAPEDNEESTEGGENAEDKSKSGGAESSEEATPEGEASGNKKTKPKMEETPPEEAAGPSTPSSYPWLEVAVEFGGLNRNLSYHQDQSNPRLLPYSLGLGPIVTGKLVLYPAEPFLAGPLENLGVEGEIEQAFVSSSLQSGAGSFTNIVHDFGGGVRYRIPFGGTNQLFVSGTGGEHAFTFNGSNRVGLNIPDTIYHYIRPGAGVRVVLPIGISLSLEGGYRYIFNHAGPQFSGERFFPHLTVAGADVELGAGYALTRSFEARIDASWRRYWYAMHSTVADQTAGLDIAGGAVDQYLTVTAGVAFTYGGGVAKSEPGAEEPPPPPPPKPGAKGRRHPSDSDEDSQKSDGDSDSGDSGGKKSGDDADQ